MAIIKKDRSEFIPASNAIQEMFRESFDELRDPMETGGVDVDALDDDDLTKEDEKLIRDMAGNFVVGTWDIIHPDYIWCEQCSLFYPKSQDLADFHPGHPDQKVHDPKGGKGVSAWKPGDEVSVPVPGIGTIKGNVTSINAGASSSVGIQTPVGTMYLTPAQLESSGVQKTSTVGVSSNGKDAVVQTPSGETRRQRATPAPTAEPPSQGTPPPFQRSGNDIVDSSVDSALSKFPPGTSDVKTVKMVSGSEIGETTAAQFFSSGPNTGTMEVNEDMFRTAALDSGTRQRLDKTIAHEVAHSIPNDHPVSQALFTQYDSHLNTYNASTGSNFEPVMRGKGSLSQGETSSAYKKVKGPKPVTAYAMTNRSEYRSEVVAHYITNPKKLQKSDPDAFNIMRDLWKR